MLQISECSLCFEDFKDDQEHLPKIMKCGDTFCSKCIEPLILDEKIICPICKDIITEKIDEMPINKYTLIQEKKIVCDKCLEEYTIELNSKKAPRILKCGDTFCTECLEKSRSNGKIICSLCKSESNEEVKNLYINKCIVEEYKHKKLLNFKYLDKEIKDINNFDLKFSVGLMGESNGGKTSIAHFFKTGKPFENSPISTIGFDFDFRFISCKKKIIKLTLYDTAGQEKFTSLSAGCLRGVQSLLLVFSLSFIKKNEDENVNENYTEEEKLKFQKEYTQKTFKTVTFWLNQFNSFNNQEKKIIYLIGNKSDDIENRIINRKDAKDFAEKHNLKYFETSAKTGRNIQAVFKSLILDLMEIYSCENENSSNNIKLQKKTQKRKKLVVVRKLFIF